MKSELKAKFRQNFSNIIRLILSFLIIIIMLMILKEEYRYLILFFGLIIAIIWLLNRENWTLLKNAPLLYFYFIKNDVSDEERIQTMSLCLTFAFGHISFLGGMVGLGYVATEVIDILTALSLFILIILLVIGSIVYGTTQHLSLISSKWLWKLSFQFIILILSYCTIFINSIILNEIWFSIIAIISSGLWFFLLDDVLDRIHFSKNNLQPQKT